MSEADQKIIFEPFRQLETRLSKNFGGNGLGLAIVKAYTERLNGTLSLKSEKNKGTSFVISIPVNKEDAVYEEDFRASERHISKYSKEPLSTILIAEDEYGNYRYLYELLHSSSTKILYASNGEEAIELCKSNNDIDLILMDIRMPVMDGDAAAKVIKEIKPEIPIIAQTAYAMESEKMNYLNIFDDLISKPINRRELREKMEKYMHVTI